MILNVAGLDENKMYEFRPITFSILRGRTYENVGPSGRKLI